MEVGEEVVRALSERGFVRVSAEGIVVVSDRLKSERREMLELGAMVELLLRRDFQVGLKFVGEEVNAKVGRRKWEMSRVGSVREVMAAFLAFGEEREAGFGMRWEIEKKLRFLE